MNLFIYVLLLSIWTNSCLNTNQSDGSSTTGAKHVEPMENKMDSFRKRLLVIIIGIMIIAFVFTCFCFLHYNCMSDDATKSGTLKKEDVTTKSSRSSKTPFSESKEASPCILEKQSMLSSIDKLSGPSSPEKSSIPSSAEKLMRPLSPGKQCISSSTEKVKRPPRPQKISRSSHPGKSHRTHNLEKPHKQAHAHKLGGQSCSSYPNKAMRLPSPAGPQHPVRTTKPPSPQKQTSPTRQSSLQKLTSSSRRRNLKRSVSTSKAGMLPRSRLIKTCQYYKEKRLVCRNSSEPLVNSISEAKDRNVQNSPFSSKAHFFSKSCRKGDYRDNVLFCGNVSSSDITYDSNESDREITIVCHTKNK
ncbi:uncharacterized protein CXorf66 homolog [Meles meles]|uniref:uncharacterized protein CXorf66 homolog n=1 Tax=Meles meles TaxID=9662 RepID=UPI001E69CF50|nr:uncharacterized protein CXorf66 homolog [Meles meles]